MKQYLEVAKDILENGSMVHNQRTGANCLTVIDKTLRYTPEEFPLVTTRKSYWKQAICEIMCYMRAYTDLRDFHLLGVNTWDANCQAWQSEHKKHEFDCGTIYGASAKAVGIDYPKIIQMLKGKPDDRGIIWNFWNPEFFDKGCLRPCMYAHQFNVVNNKLYLTSSQRSCDFLLGGNFNMVQVWFLWAVTAKLAGLDMGGATHHIVNCHIYENQIEKGKEQIQREPFKSPTFKFLKEITLEDIMENINKENIDEYFAVDGYEYHPAIKFPFTV